MNTFLALLLIAAMIATLVALIRGVVIFLKNTEADLKGTGPSDASIRSNKMMKQRILFQGLAIFIVAIILMIGSAKS